MTTDTPQDPVNKAPATRVAALRLTPAMRFGLLGVPRLAAGMELPRFSGPLGAWKLRRRYLAIFLDDQGAGGAAHVVGLGVVIPGNKSGSYERGFEVEVFEQLSTGLPVPRLARRLGTFADALTSEGPMTATRGQRVIDAIRQESSDLASDLDALIALVDQPRPQDRATEIIAAQRDMTGLLLLASDMDRRPLRDWHGYGTRADFLRDALPEVLYEDDAIRHDWQRLPEWFGGVQVSWTEQRFFKGNRSLSIFYGNTRELEHQTGVDLVYYNEHHGCFVCVQYKKLKHEPQAGWVYRPDQGLDSELERMREIDDSSKVAIDQTDIRLLATPTFFKLHEPMEFEAGSMELVAGMYLSREHFELLLDKNRGEKNGRRIGYSTVPRHLNNSMFAELLGNGWIGTRGVGTDLVRDQVLRSVTQNRGLVVGVTDHDLGNAHRPPRRSRASSGGSGNTPSA